MKLVIVVAIVCGVVLVLDAEATNKIPTELKMQDRPLRGTPEYDIWKRNKLESIEKAIEKRKMASGGKHQSLNRPPKASMGTPKFQARKRGGPTDYTHRLRSDMYTRTGNNPHKYMRDYVVKRNVKSSG